MNKLLLALVLMFATLVWVTGCGNSGSNEQAKGSTDKKAEDKKPTDPKPSQDKKPQEMIVGRWEGTDSKGQPCAVEFTAFGTVKTVRPERGAGKYLVGGDGSLDMEFTKGDSAETQKCKVTISDESLAVVDGEGKSLEAIFVMPGKYKRVKTFSAAVWPVSELILGKWGGAAWTGGPVEEWEFRRDGTFSVFRNDKGKGADSPNPKILVYPSRGSGNYKVAGTNLELVFTSTRFLEWEKKQESEKTRRTTIVVGENKLQMGGITISGTVADFDIEKLNLDVKSARTESDGFGGEFARIRDKSDKN